MRKFTFTLGCLVFTMLANAQIQKKDVLLGGNLGVNYSQNGPNQTNSNGSFQPFVQFAYKNNRTIGFNLDMYFSSNTSNDGQFKSQNFSLGPAINFTQYHPIKGAFGWWLQEEAGARFSNAKYIGPAGEQKSDATTVFLNVTPGLFYAIGEKRNWLLTTSVGGIWGSYSGSNGVDSWSFGTNLFQYYRFGFAYIFRK